MAFPSPRTKVAGVELVEAVAATETPSLVPESDDPGNLTLLQSFRQFPKVVGFVMALCPAILLYGFDLVIVGSLSALPTFQKDYGVKFGSIFIIPSLWLGLWSAASPIGAILGAFLAGPIQDRYGRRLSLALGALLAALGIGIAFASYASPDIDVRRGVFLFGKLVEGSALGVVTTCTQTYMSEITPRSLRAPSMALFPICTLLGQLLGAVVLYSLLNVDDARSYLTCIATQWPFSIVLLGIAFWIPESPPWLVRKGRMDEATKAHERLSRKGGDVVVAVKNLAAVLEMEQRNSKGKIDYRQCFAGSDLRRTGIVVIANLMPQFFGVTLLGNAAYFMQTIGMDVNNSVKLLQVGIVVGLISNLICVWTLSVAPRRPLMLITLGITTVLWTAIGVAGCFSGPAMVWYIAISMMVIIFVCGCGVWPASVAVAAETSSLRLRAKTQAVGWGAQAFASGLFAIVLPYIFNPDQGNIGGKTGFVFAVFCALSVVLVWLFVPEMKGRTSSEIDIMFTSRIPTRQFRQWSGVRIVVPTEEFGGEETTPMLGIFPV